MYNHGSTLKLENSEVEIKKQEGRKDNFQRKITKRAQMNPLELSWVRPCSYDSILI